MLDAVYSRYGEEVNIVVTMFEEIFHLSGSPLDTELLGIFVGFTFQYFLCEFFRNIAVEGFRHYSELAQLGERLDGRNNRDGYAHLPSLFNESIELLVVVEELGNGIRCAQLLFLQEMLHIHFEVGCLFMLLRIAGYTAAELVARVLDGSAIKEETVIKLIHLLQQVSGMGMTILGWCKLPVFFRLVSSQNEDVADAQKLEVEQFVLDVFLRSTAADNMRDDRYVVLILYSACDGHGARAAAHTLAGEETVFQFLVYILAMVRSDVDKARTKLAQRIDGTEECCCSVTFQRR